MSSEDSSGKGEHSEDRRGHSRRSPRTPGLRDSDSDSASKGGEARGSEESDKAEWSEEDRGTKVSTLICPGPLMITMFPTGHMWPTAHQEGAEGGDEVRQESKRRPPQHGAPLSTD